MHWDCGLSLVVLDIRTSTFCLIPLELALAKQEHNTSWLRVACRLRNASEVCALLPQKAVIVSLTCSAFTYVTGVLVAHTGGSQRAPVAAHAVPPLMGPCALRLGSI